MYKQNKNKNELSESCDAFILKKNKKKLSRLFDAFILKSTSKIKNIQSMNAQNKSSNFLVIQSNDDIGESSGLELLASDCLSFNFTFAGLGKLSLFLMPLVQ